MSYYRKNSIASFFFFQAEDGIRGGHVTGVQTCALPISRRGGCSSSPRSPGRERYRAGHGRWRSLLLLFDFSRAGAGGHALARPGAGDELFERGGGEHDLVVDENVVGVDLIGVDQVHVLQVAQRLPSEVVVAGDHREHGAVDTDAFEHLRSGAGRGNSVDAEVLHHVHATTAGPVGKRAAQGGCLHLLRGALAVVARARAVDDATAGPLRGADRTVTGAPGALLAPGLPATAADLAAGLDLVGALTRSSLLRHHDMVDEWHVDHYVENLGGQIGGAGLLARGVDDVYYCCHCLRPLHC